MSKLDSIILECINKALAGKEEKLGDYVDPTKAEVKALIVELVDECAYMFEGTLPMIEASTFKAKVEAL